MMSQDIPLIFPLSQYPCIFPSYFPSHNIPACSPHISPPMICALYLIPPRDSQSIQSNIHSFQHFPGQKWVYPTDHTPAGADADIQSGGLRSRQQLFFQLPRGARREEATQVMMTIMMVMMMIVMMMMVMMIMGMTVTINILNIIHF